MNLFNQFNLSPQLQTAIERLGITQPTEIQSNSITPILDGKDVIAESATGSGKTLAFGCGLIERIKPGSGLQAIILTPTRELAEQVKEVMKDLSYQQHLKIMAVYGGVSINPQIEGLSQADLVVATPGRLLDHLGRGTLNTSKMNILVLDEADRMFDMGFIDDVKQIIKACPNRKQTLLFSATISQKVKQLADKYMHEPVEVFAENMVDPERMEQVYYDVDKNMKLSLLVHLLQKENSGLAMVFCNTRRNTDFVVKNLKANGLNSIAIHGGLSQNKRSRTIELFNKGKVGVLVCTDIAARGLDIEHVSHVYNYDISEDPNDYIHRIGRTARAGKSGKVINIISHYDHQNFSRVMDEYHFFVLKNVEMPSVKRIFAKMEPARQRFSSERQSFGRSFKKRW